MPHQNTPTADELEWIGRFLDFANHARFATQQEVYEIFFKRPHPFILWSGDKAIFHAIPEPDGVKPFLNDQKEIRRALRGLANREPGAGDRTKAIVAKHLGRTLDATLNVRWKMGELRLDVEPKLTGVEACVYYPLALLLHYQLDHRVRTCRARIWREQRYIERWVKDEGHDALKERHCEKFFISSLNGATLKGCSKEHGKLISKQNNVRRVQKHRRKQAEV